MSSVEKMKELRKKEREIDAIFEQLKMEKKKEVIEQIKSLLQENKTAEARVLIQKIEELKELKWERNERVLMDLEEMFEIPAPTFEMEYEQLKMETERKDNKKEIESIFLAQLEKRGFHLEEKKSDVLKLRKEGQVMFFFEADEKKSLIKEIENKKKYTTLLIGLKNVEEEERAEAEILGWLENTTPSQKESIQKYLTLNITSKERLNSEMESTKKIKIA